MGRTCGEPDEIKKNTHPKMLPLFWVIRDGILRSGFNAIQSFAGMGDYRHEPHTHHARFVMVTTSEVRSPCRQMQQRCL